MKRMRFLNSPAVEAKKAAELAAAREADRAYKAAHKKFAENKISNVDYDFDKISTGSRSKSLNYYSKWSNYEAK